MSKEMIRSLRVSAARAATAVIEQDLGRLPIFQVICNAYIKGMCDSARIMPNKPPGFAAEVVSLQEDLYHKEWKPSEVS